MFNIPSKIVQYFTLVFVLCATSYSSFAVVSCPSAAACKGPIEELVDGVFPTASGDLLITSPVIIDNLACTGSSGGNNLILTRSTHAGFEETYALILYALSKKANVTFRMTNASLGNNPLTACDIAYVRLDL